MTELEKEVAMLKAKLSEMNQASSSTDIAHNADKAKLPDDTKHAEEESDAELIDEAKPEEPTCEEFRHCNKVTQKTYGKLGGRPKRKIDECLVKLFQNLLQWRNSSHVDSSGLASSISLSSLSSSVCFVSSGSLASSALCAISVELHA